MNTVTTKKLSSSFLIIATICIAITSITYSAKSSAQNNTAPFNNYTYINQITVFPNTHATGMYNVQLYASITPLKSVSQLSLLQLNNTININTYPTNNYLVAPQDKITLTTLPFELTNYSKKPVKKNDFFEISSILSDKLHAFLDKLKENSIAKKMESSEKLQKRCVNNIS